MHQAWKNGEYNPILKIISKFCGFNAIMFALAGKKMKSVEYIAEKMSEYAKTIKQEGYNEEKDPGNLNYIPDNYGTILVQAVVFNYYDIVKKLIKLGANINQVVGGRSILMWAKCDKKMMDLLKSLGADPNFTNSFGFTADDEYKAFMAWTGIRGDFGCKLDDYTVEQFKKNIKAEQKAELEARRGPYIPRYSRTRRPDSRRRNS